MEGGTGGERGRGWGGEERRVNVDDEVDERVGHRRETYRTDVAWALQIGVSYGGTIRSLFHGTRQGQMSGIAAAWGAAISFVVFVVHVFCVVDVVRFYVFVVAVFIVAAPFAPTPTSSSSSAETQSRSLEQSDVGGYEGGRRIRRRIRRIRHSLLYE